MRIHQRHAHFERMRHARPIRIAKKLVAHVERRLERGHSAIICARHRFEHRIDVSERVETPETLGDEVMVHQAAQLPRHEQPATQEVGAGETSAELKQSCNLWIDNRSEARGGRKISKGISQ